MAEQEESRVVSGPKRSDVSTPGRSPHRRLRKVSSETVTWDQIIGPVGWVKIVVLGLLVCLVFWNEIRHQMIGKWMDFDGNWTHGFLIPLFSLYFLHQRRERLLKAALSYTWVNWLGLALLVGSIAGYLLSIYPLKMGYPKLMAILGATFGVVLFCCGWRVIKVTWLPILYMFFAMPIPQRLYEQLTIPMRKWASEVSVVVLNLLPGMDLTAVGVIIEGTYNGAPMQMSVEEACAGMRLMMAFFALGVAMAYLSDRPYWHRIVLVLSTLPIALLCNFARVTITCILYAMVNEIFAKGGFHTTLGLLMLPLAFFLYWLIAEILSRIYIYEDVEVEE